MKIRFGDEGIKMKIGNRRLKIEDREMKWGEKYEKFSITEDNNKIKKIFIGNSEKKFFLENGKKDHKNV